MKYFTSTLGLLALLVVPALAFAANDFVPLTNIPVLFDTGNAINTPEGLSIFLNNIYKVCIGVAAVVAVLQIMRAGIMYMGGDSVTEKKDAKNLIAMSIGGLILVLSPVIVFSIINPSILTLKIEGIDALGVADRPLDVDTGGAGGGGGDDDGGLPPTPPAPEDMKSFFEATSAWSVAAAQLYETVCNDGTIPSSATDIIKNKRPRGPEATMSGNPPKTLYTVYCESFSHNFTRYVLGAYDPRNLEGKVVTVESELRYAPGEAEKQARFAGGCSADGGKLVRDADWFWSGYGGCSAAVKASVYADTSTTDETHGINCQQEEYRCVKPDNITPPQPLF
ncbi:pilin [Patescibacteria group bacterium]|nr:pilin [Patescibacteria group bacterium]MBU2220596.1 pilin [Patescibacteria group bacterium]